ncbi:MULTISPECIES: TylF/MycF/NovP-related O-methyltransferase [unclassified Haladaptatus]|uniref:TylF/MycF/NovP-related O-methyltransferase n=1 Tax=unclassified Haladaptatus TaxID=2622732 RepID=UPI00209C328F|nr:MULTISPECIES: TylF/MycF/NovP-related O-methyltransferase [unclassified Haladaptatus]MCO8244176.1 TylF/MycF family methyltransferase [Haladaptatus sp. AB643]MCO8255981.1 TylF/MycF family methyltransferase [Haladaptatus sp. AB618]
MKQTARAAIAAISRLYRFALLVASMPVVLAEFFRPETGAEYGVGFLDKVVLAARMARNNVEIQTGSTFLEHLVIATKVLTIPPDVEGSLVECGCYKGGSTANLSLVAGLCDRPLEVFDSFEGMPEPNENDREHTLIKSEQVHTYDEDSWGAPIEEVQENIARYGDISVCRFHPGYFDRSMPSFEEPCALVFLDVGLRESAETCLEHLWPLLVSGGYCFTHDVKHMEISTLFFDADWWRETLDREPPGLVGAGSGLGLHPEHNGFGSLLGYIVKDPTASMYELVAEDGEDENCVEIIRKRDGETGPQQ